MRLIKTTGICFWMLVLGVSVCVAHKGKTDSYGCHNNRKIGDYHCHSGLLVGQVFANKAEMLAALKGNDAGAKTKPQASRSSPSPVPSQQQEQSVMFNTKSLKYHSPTCQWAIKCTKNCISIPLSEAINRGGIPCKVCGGH